MKEKPIDLKKTMETLDSIPWPSWCPACEGNNLSIRFAGAGPATIVCTNPDCGYMVRRPTIVPALMFWFRMQKENPPTYKMGGPEFRG